MPQSLDAQLMSQSGFVPPATLEHHVYHQQDQLVGLLQEQIAPLVELQLAFHAQLALLDITIGLEVFAIQLYKQILQIASPVLQCGHFAQFAPQDSSFKQQEVAQLPHAETTAQIAHQLPLAQLATLPMLLETEFASL